MAAENHVRIYTRKIAPSARAGRREAEREAVNALIKSAFGAAVALEHDAAGRPYLPAVPDVHISISHCVDECVLAVSDRPVGIDIENARPQLVRLAPKFLTLSEQSAGPHDLPALMRYWTAKEAVFKCAGISGLVISGIEVRHESADRSLAICASRTRGEVCLGDETLKFFEKFSVAFPLVSPEKVIAVAVKKVKDSPINIRFV